MPTTASFNCGPLPQPPKYQQLFRPLGGSHQAVASKLIDSSKFKVTVKSDTDIPALVFFKFVCFVLFIFFLSYFLSIVFFFLLFCLLCLFLSFCLFLFINLRTCNSIYILTRTQNSQASR